ncbi:MAG: spondin domain-containing protein [Pyrinomonadaceae bacterium]
MIKQKFLFSVAILATFICGTFVSALAADHKVKKQATFKVRIENISDKDGIVAKDGSKYPFALSPGFFVVSSGKTALFTSGRKASAAIESQAEDGHPELLATMFPMVSGSVMSGIFSKPIGADMVSMGTMASPILPGSTYEFEFTATKGQRLQLATMYGQSNDLFYAAEKAVALFDAKGKPVNGDITDKFRLWDAGTEVNQAPGIGPDQAPRQKAPNTGAAENGVVHLVKDGFSYPNTKDVLRITITAN